MNQLTEQEILQIADNMGIYISDEDILKFAEELFLIRDAKTIYLAGVSK